ncbi:MAG: hypothetical protein KAI17_13650 [Thiotrichaceae bacterium]|nr:hypothetical protein [Thiotrichaceae bacterium]
MAKRKVVFFVPCNAINMAVTGFFEAENRLDEMGCCAFDFQPGRDINKMPVQNDYGVWKNVHKYLAPLKTSYEKAVILLDAQFPGSPGADIIKQDITENMLASGWQQEDFTIGIFDPELEALLWQANIDLLADIIKFQTQQIGLSQWLIDEGWLQEGVIVPEKPKEALEAAIKLNLAGKNIRHSVVCKQFAQHSKLEDCIDLGFKVLVQQFQSWFPISKHL